MAYFQRFICDFNMLISFGLVIFSLILALVLKKPTNVLRFVAMVFGFLGDLTLAFYINMDNSFLWGVAFFIICHIFYFLAYKKEVKNLFNKGFWIGEGITYLFIIGIIISFFKGKIGPGGPEYILLLGISIFYGLIIGTVCSAVTACAYEKRTVLSILNVLGILFFIISDFLIGINFFNIDFQLRNDLIWIFYPIGQFLLILDWNKKGVKNEL
ncbi:MAG: hypothetical protein IJS60_05960 [Abditibacteriota bacterium]|nr:hypothetical protein [Abditibacteriota bacterium]